MTVHHCSFSWVVCAALMTTIPCIARHSAAADNAQTMARVRSSDRSIVELIERATHHSPTLDKLIGRVETSNGIVYVEPGICPQRVPACLKVWMVTTGSVRFMRIVVDRHQLDSDSTLLGAIGHELQHAIEVLSDPTVTDSNKMFFFYRRYAPTQRDQFETWAAVSAGDAVQHELRNWRGKASSVDPPYARPF